MDNKRPRLLDLFCGAGGAAMGYYRAGFDVVGVDIVPMPHYPFEFHQDDALEYVCKHGAEFDVIHASPPCQRYTRAQNAAKNSLAHPDLIGPVRDLLIKMGKPFVIENVVGAPLKNPAVLCGLSFGLKVKRHRLFETSFFFLTPPCQCKNQDYFVIFGHEVRNRRHGVKAGRKNKIAEGRAAMGIEWMTRGELSEAIPPAYTEYIGRYLFQLLLANNQE
jgi:DNA (cytosine-5)-methyltransferase 1